MIPKDALPGARELDIPPWKVGAIFLTGCVVGFLFHRSTPNAIPAITQKSLPSSVRTSGAPQFSASRAFIAERPPTSETHTSNFNLTENQRRDLQTFNEQRRAYYAPLFDRLNLDNDQKSHFLEKLNDLHEAAIYSGESTLALMLARIEYDSEIKLALGEDNYREYRRIEASRVAEREVDIFREDAKSKSIQVPENELKQIGSIFEKIGLQTRESWDRPYDPIPRPAAGSEMVAGNIESEISTISNALSLFRQSTDNTVKPETVALVENYLHEEIDRLNKSLVAVRMTPEERMQSYVEIERQREQNTQTRRSLNPPPNP